MHSNSLHGFAVNEGRLSKAVKIEAVLLASLRSNNRYLSDRTMIDIGCGTGHIAAYFSKQNNLVATDVVDQLSDENRRKIRFIRFETLKMPFSDQEFEIAILNHVIAHTEFNEQLLAETFRILKKGGLCYIANPNRLFPVEPFFRIPLLHYLPNSVFLRIARYLRKDVAEDIYLLSYFSLKRLCKRVGFETDDFSVRVINEPDTYFSEYRLPFGMKVPMLASVISPTNIFILRKPIN
jgi:ubiquinone/menaquinone biosynthesis C-methylase UbiE